MSQFLSSLFCFQSLRFKRHSRWLFSRHPLPALRILPFVQNPPNPVAILNSKLIWTKIHLHMKLPSTYFELVTRLKMLSVEDHALHTFWIVRFHYWKEWRHKYCVVRIVDLRTASLTQSVRSIVHKQQFVKNCSKVNCIRATLQSFMKAFLQQHPKVRWLNRAAFVVDPSILSPSFSLFSANSRYSKGQRWNKTTPIFSVLVTLGTCPLSRQIVWRWWCVQIYSEDILSSIIFSLKGPLSTSSTARTTDQLWIAQQRPKLR